MEIVVCDYTGLFDDPTRSAVSTITCKFVLLCHEQKHWLVVGRLDEFAYHAMLVHRFSNERGLPIRWVKLLELAEFEADCATILGGGWLKIDPEARSIKLYGTSTAYGTGEYQLAAQALSAHPDFGQLAVSF